MQASVITYVVDNRVFQLQRTTLSNLSHTFAWKVDDKLFKAHKQELARKRHHRHAAENNETDDCFRTIRSEQQHSPYGYSNIPIRCNRKF